MGTHCLLFLGILIAPAGAIDSWLRTNLRATKPVPDPIAGQKVTIISDEQQYVWELQSGGLMRMLERGGTGIVEVIDFEGRGSCLVKINANEKAWVPIRALVGFEKWCKGTDGCPGPPPATAPPPPSPAAAAMAAAASALPAASPAAAGPAGPTTTTFPLMIEPVDIHRTDFAYSSCRRTDEEEVDLFSSPLGMSLNICFEYCRKRDGMRYFAVTDGKSCYCSALPKGREVSSDNCDSVCSGNPSETCGGVADAASVYNMIDCVGDTPAEKNEHLLDTFRKFTGSYSKFEGESCGLDRFNKIKIGGSYTMTGTADDCMVACWSEKGSENCHGFTYITARSKCHFHTDVIQRRVNTKKGVVCYFKKIGYKVDKALTWD